MFYKGQFLGKTPVKNALIRVEYYLVGYGMIISNGWSAGAPGNEYIFVEKEGYAPAGGKPIFKKNTSRLKLEKSHYSVGMCSCEGYFDNL